MKKIILIIATYSLFITSAFCQEIEWQNTIGGTNFDELKSIKQTTDGGYIIGGTSASGMSNDKSENSMGNKDYWIVKMDATGNIQWDQTIGGGDEDIFSSIQQTTDGGFIIGGYSNSNISGDKTENSNGGDYWIVKTDATGNIQWQNTIGGNYGDYLNSVQQTSDGGYILGGNSNSNISGDKTENCNGNTDYWIVKTDATGNIQWQNTIGGNNNDNLYSVQQTSDGGYILGGTSYSGISGDKTEGALGSEDYWIVKTDNTGNIQWQNTIGGSNEDYFSNIEQTADGGYVLGGHSFSGVTWDKTEWNVGGADLWIIKLDTVGTIQWQNTIGGNNYDKLAYVNQTTDGGYIIGASSYSGCSGDKTEFSNGDWDCWILKLNSTGDIQLQNTIGGTANDAARYIYQTSDGSYILGGLSISGNSGDKTEGNLGVEDYWIIKLTDKYNLITGKLFIDLDSNQIQGFGEQALINKKITENNSNRITFTNQTGHYNLVVLDSGNFTINTTNTINYYAAAPSSYNIYFNNILQTDSLKNFAFQPTGEFNDLCITISPLGPFRAGFNANYMVNYENIGTTTLNPTVIFFPDNDVTFVSANPTATSVTTDSVVWNVGTLAPFQTGNILVTVHVNTGTPIGTLINSNVRIEPVTGDSYPGCNYAYWEVYTIGSYDPNEILVDRDSVLITELSSPSYLNYIIYFQNTGNDTAFNVQVLNNIPQMSDVNSFEFVASSHPVNITYGEHARLMTFTFDNILLPDSGINEPASHGFIRYRIKPNTTLVAGDSIENTSYIYFDFNQPVQTNTAVTEIVLPTGEEEFEVQSSNLKVFPNPAKEELIVNSALLTGKKAEIIIYDLFGREVLKMEAGGQKSEVRIDASGFSKGVYIIEMRADEKVLRGKFLKE